MQEIHEEFHDGNELRKIRDSLTGEESSELRKAFDTRRAAALKRHADRLGNGVESQLKIKETHSIGRNDPCPCGSELKFKKCCGRNLAADDERVG